MSGAPELEARRRTAHRSKLFRVARFLFVAIAGAEALYIIAANGVIEFGGLTALLRGTDSLKASVASGWTIFPGIVHVRGLLVTFQDHNVETAVQMKRADVTVSLHELPWRVFHATKVRGSGLVFRFRNRVQPNVKDEPSVRALPPIVGFEDPPVYEAWAPEPPISDADYNLWTIHIENVDVIADELWVQQFRYLGHARAVGSFELRPARQLWVNPASLVLDPGRVVAAGQNAFTLFSGTVDCTVHPFDVRLPYGFAVLRDISTKMHLSGDVAGGEFLDLFLPESAEAHVEPKGAKFVIDAVVRHGVVAAETRVRLEGHSLHVQVARISADAAGPWSVVGTGENGGRIVLTASRAIVTRYGTHSAPIAIRGAIAAVDSTSLDATVSWGVRGADLTLGELAVPDLRVLNDARLDPVHFHGGSGVLRGRAAYSGRTVSGNGTVELRDAVAAVAENEIRGSGSLNATVRAFDERRGTGSFDLGLQGNALAVDDVSEDAACPWGRFETTEAEMHLSLLPHGRARGKIDASIKGGTLDWGDLRVRGNCDVRATIEPVGAAENDESRLIGIVRAFQLRVRSGAGPPKRWSADLPRTILDASLVLRDGRLDGPVEITSESVSASIGDVSMRTDVRARLRVAPLDVLQRSAIVSGAVDVTRASLWNGDRRVEGWWAQIGVSPTRVVAGQDLELDGLVSARFRDGLPGLLALSANDDIPGFLPGLLPLNGLVGTLDVQRHCQLSDVRFSSVRGGPLVASGRIQNVPGDTHGAVLVRLSGLELVSAGMSLGEHGNGVSLFAGDEWLTKQTADLRRQAAWVTTHACVPPPKSVCD